MTVVSMQKICGFIVVRKPEYASNGLIRPNLEVGGKTYHGIDRLRWEDLDLAYYERRLPAAVFPIWQALDRDTSDFSGVKLLKDFKKAKEVLCFSGDKSEIIAIYSAELEAIKGAAQCDIELEYLGIDCFSLGEWSVLLGGVYAKPAYFVEAARGLNKHGLLDSIDDCRAVFNRYVQLAMNEIVEPLMDGARATSVKVFAVSARH
jgi:hypothetical protein